MEEEPGVVCNHILVFATSTFPGGTMQGTDGEGQPRLVHPWPHISVSPGELLDIPKPTV